MRGKTEAGYKARQKHDCACMAVELTASQQIAEAGSEGLVEADGGEVGNWVEREVGRGV